MPELTLFEPCDKLIGKRSMARTESAYEYYRCSQRKSMEALKENLEVWFSSFPTDGKLDLQQRFRSRIKGQHDAAYFELHLHRLFTQMGFGLGVHPDLEGEKTHPDYLVLRDGAPLFYLEATIARDSETEASEKQRANQVLEALEQLKSPDFSLSIRVQGVPTTPPPGAKLRKKLEQWLATLKYEEVVALWQSEDLDSMPRFLWKHEGWELTVEPIPKSLERRGSTDVRAIGMTLPEVRTLSLHEDVRKAVELKNRYGDLDLPFLLAINVTDEFSVGKIDVMNALFGEETVIFDRDGARPGSRLPNGAWFTKYGPRNTKISAVMVYANVGPWNAKQREPWIVHNPWAKIPFLSTYLPLRQFVADHSTNTMPEQEGPPAGSFLGLPEPWPISED
jgi:hypothetical protein